MAIVERSGREPVSRWRVETCDSAMALWVSERAQLIALRTRFGRVHVVASWMDTRDYNSRVCIVKKGASLVIIE